MLLAASFDTPEDNAEFARKEGFGFTMLSDVDRTVGVVYDTKRHPTEMSPEYAKRRTYLIDPDGVIRKAYRVRDTAAHPDEVLADLLELQTSG